MIPLIITALLIPGAICAAVALEPHMEAWATRKALYEAHKASHAPPEHRSGNDNPLQKHGTKQADKHGESA
ncbi:MULTISPECIES: hypothetical protein [unclassified Brevibacterium]|uniref:hypothetical protein n=1 Tax=unclassified Brevibacterium TaxID=2614124 RepID=UPI001E592A64|nr:MULTISPECIES: hypothetical protein [unclassified Brevibacterium]MCD1287316.1 hypothetical protein [Brevibacterium sp. CCUG 69071]MDK8436430.1 hypothetical protein [Brevibacterium sp. H-BE7]